MIQYTGNGATCYANSLHMCLEAAGTHPVPHAGFLECLTLMPFGCFLLEDGDLQTFFPSPSWMNPDMGLQLALQNLGWRCEEEQATTPGRAGQLLALGLQTGPVLLGPLDMYRLSYYSRRGTVRSVADHYVVALFARNDQFVLHDPSGFPCVEIASDELLAAWGAKVDYGQPFTLRYAFREDARLDTQEVIRRTLISLRERAGNDDTGPALWGGVHALVRMQELLKRGPSASLAGGLVRFPMSTGAVRCLDGARFLLDAGHLIRIAEEWLEMMDVERQVYVSPDEFHIFEAALEALQEQERQRIEHMRDGIARSRSSACGL